MKALVTTQTRERSAPIPFRRVHPDFARRPTEVQTLIHQPRRPDMRKQRQNRTTETTFTATPQAKRGRPAKRTKAAEIEVLEQFNLHAAGIDVGSAQNFVCVAAQAVKSGQSNVRSFGAVELSRTFLLVVLLPELAWNGF